MVDPDAQAPPSNDVPDGGINEQSGNSLIGFGNEIKTKILQGQPDFLPLLKHYGFDDKDPLFFKHWHTKKGFSELRIGGMSSLLTYLVFAIELIARIIYWIIYVAILVGALLVIGRGLNLPEYIVHIKDIF